MAVIQYITSTQPTAASGGIVYYRNGGQIAMRSRAMPIAPPTTLRTANLNVISVLSETWEQITNADRIGWGAYAYSTPLLNAWNAPIFVRGYAHYMRSNRPRLMFGLPRIDPPPTTNGIPDYTTPTAQVQDDLAHVAITITTSDAWATELNAALLLWVSPARSPARSLHPNNWSRLAMIRYTGTALPTVTTLPLPVQLHTRHSPIWIRSGVTRADGRYTSSYPI